MVFQNIFYSYESLCLTFDFQLLEPVTLKKHSMKKLYILFFWILAILVGLFQGGIQALSRSYYGKIIPKNRANEYYGFYDIFGKTASIIGTFLVATTTSLTGNASVGVLSIAILLIVALIFLLLQKDPTRK